MALLGTTRLRGAAVTAVLRQQRPAMGGSGAAPYPVPVPVLPAAAHRRALVAAGGLLMLLLQSERGTRQRLTELGAHETVVSSWSAHVGLRLTHEQLSWAGRATAIRCVGDEGFEVCAETSNV